jgi:hypothetical protein
MKLNHGDQEAARPEKFESILLISVEMAHFGGQTNKTPYFIRPIDTKSNGFELK